MKVIEKTYRFIFKNLKRAVNPVKKRIIKTECEVHKFINNQALEVLKNDGHKDAYNFLASYIEDINEGGVWADQDLKSSNHFYNPITLKGLFGNSNAKRECMSYYKKAVDELYEGDLSDAMFFLGAACHLIQDMTVPQHANVRLLNSHRRYEKWVIRMHRHHDEFKVNDGGIYLDSVKHYIDLNSKRAINTHERYSYLKDSRLRFYKITSVILVMAQRTTAGLMLKFFNDTKKVKNPKKYWAVPLLNI